jgi:hypothetical protein
MKLLSFVTVYFLFSIGIFSQNNLIRNHSFQEVSTGLPKSIYSPDKKAFISLTANAYHIFTRTIPLLLKDATRFSEIWPIKFELLFAKKVDIGLEIEVGGYMFNFYDIQFPGLHKVRSLYVAPGLKALGFRGWFTGLRNGEGIFAKVSFPIMFYSAKIEEVDGSIRPIKSEVEFYLSPGLGFQKLLFKRLLVAGGIEYQRPIFSNSPGLFYSHHFRPSVWIGYSF